MMIINRHGFIHVGYASYLPDITADIARLSAGIGAISPLTSRAPAHEQRCDGDNVRALYFLGLNAKPILTGPFAFGYR